MVFPIVQTVLWTIEIPQSLVDTVVDVPVLPVVQVSQVVMTLRLIPRVQNLVSGSCRFSDAGCEETVLLPQLQLVENSTLGKLMVAMS